MNLKDNIINFEKKWIIRINKSIIWDIELLLLTVVLSCDIIIIANFYTLEITIAHLGDNCKNNWAIELN